MRRGPRCPSTFRCAPGNVDASLRETEVRDNVWVWTLGGDRIESSYGSNCTAVAGREAVLLVDPLIAPAHADHDLAAIGGRFHRASRVALGATRFGLPEPAPRPALKARDDVVLAVVGAHLSGLPLNPQLTTRGARLLEATQTSPDYRLYALPDTMPPKPGMVRVVYGGMPIDVELARR